MNNDKASRQDIFQPLQFSDPLEKYSYTKAAYMYTDIFGYYDLGVTYRSYVI